ncbi:MAG: hypothetical protein H7330_03585 [Hymenobacteraceae bacterium]|nr:hypothetical protein [Hymenobacteraceae bacterium]
MNFLPFPTRFSLALVLTLSAPTAMFSGCSNAEQHEAAVATQSSYDDFSAYIEGVERDAQNIDLSDTDFSAAMNRTKADYDAKLAAVERDADQLNAEQRANVETLKARYTTTFEQREAAYKSRVPDTIASGATSTPGLYTPAGTGYATLPAASLRATYEQFVQNVKANENRYEIADWRAVNADWRALNARKEQIEDQLSVADRAEIAKEKVKYAAFKTFDKSEARVEAGADATKGGAYKTGQAIGRGANKAGEVIDKSAEKVGNAAKDVYKGMRDAGTTEENRKK